MGRPPASPSRRRKLRRVFILLALLLVTGGVAVIGEIAVRVYVARVLPESVRYRSHDPTDDDFALGELFEPTGEDRLVYTMKPGLRGRFLGAEIRTNSLGMRGVEVTAKHPDVTRIVALGDSNTFGWGVREDEAWPAVLERLLNESLADARRFEVLNLGIPTYDSIQEAEILRRLGPTLDPDFVVVLYDPNDIVLVDFLRQISPRSRRLLLIRFLLHKAGWMNAQEFWLDEIPRSLRDHVGPSSARRAYEEIARICEELGAPLLVLSTAHEVFEMVPALVEDPAMDPVARACAELEIPYRPTFPRTRAYCLASGLSGRELWLRWPEDFHPTPERQELIAEEAFRGIKDHGMGAVGSLASGNIRNIAPSPSPRRIARPLRSRP